jgi:hypothetical protein
MLQNFPIFIKDSSSPAANCSSPLQFTYRSIPLMSDLATLMFVSEYYLFLILDSYDENVVVFTLNKWRHYVENWHRRLKPCTVQRNVCIGKMQLLK